MAMSKEEVLFELSSIWIEITPENPIRDMLHNELMNMLSKVTNDKSLLLDLDYLIDDIYCIGEEECFYNGVEIFSRLMKE